MELENIKSKIKDLAFEIHQQDYDENCMLFEMDANYEILAYLLDKNISLGDYNLDDLYNDYDNKYVDNWFDIMQELNSAVVSDNPPFAIHPEALELFNCFNTAFRNT